MCLSCQTHELKTALAGQIARALAVFCVDEIVIYNDGARDAAAAAAPPRSASSYHHPADARYTGDADPSYFLAHILSYLETPPHLRRSLFRLHPDLRSAGSLPSLDMPHHLRANEWCVYREGVTVTREAPQQQQQQQQHGGGAPVAKRRKVDHDDDAEETSAFVDVGLPQPVILPDAVPVATRVTVRFDGEGPNEDWHDAPAPRHKGNGASSGLKKFATATAVAPSAPREAGGFYWGYAVRCADSLSRVLTECPYEGGYDVSIGTSERGVALGKLAEKLPAVSYFW